VCFTSNFWSLTIDGLNNGFLYALIALGYTLVYGVLQLINFAHSEVFMAGAFGGLFLTQALVGSGNPTGMTAVAYVIAGTLMGAVVGGVVGGAGGGGGVGDDGGAYAGVGGVAVGGAGGWGGDGGGDELSSECVVAGVVAAGVGGAGGDRHQWRVPSGGVAVGW